MKNLTTCRTEQFGLDRPNIWTQGGKRVRMTITLAALVETGAAPPDLENVARRIVDALKDAP